MLEDYGMFRWNSGTCSFFYPVSFCPSEPFRNNVMEPEKIMEYLLNIDHDECDEKVILNMRLASTLWTSSSELAKIIMSKNKLLNEFLNYKEPGFNCMEKQDFILV